VVLATAPLGGRKVAWQCHTDRRHGPLRASGRVAERSAHASGSYGWWVRPERATAHDGVTPTSDVGASSPSARSMVLTERSQGVRSRAQGAARGFHNRAVSPQSLLVDVGSDPHVFDVPRDISRSSSPATRVSGLRWARPSVPPLEEGAEAGRPAARTARTMLGSPGIGWHTRCCCRGRSTSWAGPVRDRRIRRRRSR
jgi:hypothetical protein